MTPQPNAANNAAANDPVTDGSVTDDLAANDALLRLGQTLQQSGYGFITPTPATHERVNSRAGNQLARDIEGVLGWSRPFSAEIIAPELFDLMQAAAILRSENGLWRSSLRLSLLGGQLFFHSAYPTVNADAVFFGPDTYRFAAAIEHFLTRKPDVKPDVKRAIDVCCGAGPGALSVARFCPDVPILATDINPQALRLTRVNALLAGAAHIEARHSDLLRDVEGDFDLIVANPPYLVDPSERAYRHGGGPLGAGLSLSIVAAAMERLAPGGTLLLYTGAAIIDSNDPFRAAVAEKLADFAGTWTYREIDPDVFGEELTQGVYTCADRIAAVVLMVVKGG